MQRSKDPKKTTLWVENKPMAVSFFAQSRGQYRRDIFDRTIVDEVSGRVRCAIKLWSLMGQVDFQAYIPAQKHVTTCSSVLNIASFVWPMWRKCGTYGQCSCHGHDVLPRPRLWTVISPHAKCASDACGWKSAAVAKQPWRVARCVGFVVCLRSTNCIYPPVN